MKIGDVVWCPRVGLLVRIEKEVGQLLLVRCPGFVAVLWRSSVVVPQVGTEPMP